MLTCLGVKVWTTIKQFKPVRCRVFICKRTLKVHIWPEKKWKQKHKMYFLPCCSSVNPVFDLYYLCRCQRSSQTNETFFVSVAEFLLTLSCFFFLLSAVNLFVWIFPKSARRLFHRGCHLSDSAHTTGIMRHRSVPSLWNQTRFTRTDRLRGHSSSPTHTLTHTLSNFLHMSLMSRGHHGNLVLCSKWFGWFDGVLTKVYWSAWFDASCRKKEKKIYLVETCDQLKKIPWKQTI